MIKWFVRAVLVVAIAVLAAGVVAKLSGRQQPIDIVAVTAKHHGIDLESQVVAVNGIRLHVVQAGPRDGAPVLLLHGYPELWWAWNEQIARLARAGFRVIVPDQRGYNASSKPAGVESYRIELLLQDMVELTKALGHDEVYLAGHDWGGALAWHLAIEHPQRFRKLVMFNAAHPLAWKDAREQEGPKEETINWFRTFFQIPFIPELVGRAGNWGLLVNNLRDTSRPGTFSDADLDVYRYAWDRDDSMHAMVNWYRASFRYPYEIAGDATVKVPTRIVWGMKDRFFENRMAKLSLKHCTDATLVELPDATHWLLHEEPEATSREMIELFGHSREQTHS